jgi:hypothetical protein
MIGRSGKPYTVVGAIGQGVVGYRPVGKQGRYRVRVEYPSPYNLSLKAWNYINWDTNGIPPRCSVLVNSKAAMQAAVSMAFAALMMHEGAKQLSDDLLNISKKAKLPTVPKPEPVGEQDEEEVVAEGEWCDACDCYHN